MAPLKIPFLLGGVLLISGVVCQAVPVDEGGSWEDKLNSGADAARQTARRTQDRSAAADAGEAQPCMEFGQHAASLPDRDPLFSPDVCGFDPFEDPVKFEENWNKLLDRIKKNGGPLVPYETPFEKGFQQAIGSGPAMAANLNAEKNWGDIEVLFLQEDKATARGTIVTIYRAYVSHEAGGTFVKATRFDFNADRHGVLDMVQRSEGELSSDGKVMMWAPPQAVGSGDWVSVIYVREWHQLIDVLNRGL